MSQHDQDPFDDEQYPAIFDRVVALKQYREQFEAKVSTGEVSLAELFVVADTDEAISTTKVLGLIEAMPEFGKVQTRRSFEELGISEAAHIGQVTTVQRDGLPAVLEKHAR